MNNIKGGAFPFPYGTSTNYTIMVKVNDDIKNELNRRRVALELNPLSEFHLTLLDIHVNFTNPDSIVFDKAILFKLIKNAYQGGLKNRIKLSSSDAYTRNKYEILGRGNNLNEHYFAMVFDDEIINNDTNTLSSIRIFRNDVFSKINAQTGFKINKTPTKRTIINPNDTNDKEDYAFFSTPNGYLFALHWDHWYRPENWKPHISLFRMDELSRGNPTQQEVFNFIRNYSGTPYQKIYVICWLMYFVDKTLKKIKNIDFSYNGNIKSIWISLRKILFPKLGIIKYTPINHVMDP